MRAAVIPTHNRHDDLADCVASIAVQVDEILVIDNASDPKVDAALLQEVADLNAATACDLKVFWDSEQPPNLSKMWAQGISYFRVGVSWVPEITMSAVAAATGLPIGGTVHVEPASDEPLWVAILNDDAVVPPGWFDAVLGAMESTGAVLGWSEPFGNLPHGVWKDRRVPPTNVYERVCGWAFILRYPGGPMPDIRLRWYYGDSQLDVQAAASGGCVAVGGYPVANKYPGQSTRGELARQSGLDRACFIENYGQPAW